MTDMIKAIALMVALSGIGNYAQAGTANSASPARPCAITIQVENGGGARDSLRRLIAKSCEKGQQPAVSVKADGATPFQSLVDVIIRLRDEKIMNFEIVTSATRVMMRIPAAYPATGQTELRLRIYKQGEVSVNESKSQPLPTRQLAMKLSEQKSNRNCCYVLMEIDRGAPVQAYVDGVTAIQMAAIADYWIVAKSTDSSNVQDELNALKAKIKRLEKEQVRLLERQKQSLKQGDGG